MYVLKAKNGTYPSNLYQLVSTQDNADHHRRAQTDQQDGYISIQSEQGAVDPH